MIFNITIVITKEKNWYVAKAVDLGVVSQGKTIEAAEKNLREAVELYLEDEPMVHKQLSRQSTPMVTTMSVEYA